MKLLRMHIRGFRSFSEEAMFRFPKNWGVYLLRGENQVRPELGANAAGKSTIWDALSWVLFGKSLRNLRAPSLRSWHDPEVCRVSLRFKRDKTQYRLVRTHTPNTLKMASSGNRLKPVTQEQVQKLIGFDYTYFCATILMSQFGRFFFDLRPAEKLKLFSTVLRLDFWLRCSDKAREERKRVVGVVDTLNGKIKYLSGRLDSLKSQERDVLEKQKGYRQLIERKKDEVTERRSKVLQAKEQAEVRLRLVEAQERQAQASVDAAEESLLQVDRKLSSQARPAERQAQEAVDELSSHRRRVEKLEGRCPKCYVKVTAEHRRHAIEYLDRLIEKKRKKYRKAKRSVRCLKKEVDSKQQEVDKLKAAHTRTKTEYAKAEKQVTEYSIQLRSIDKELQQLGREDTFYGDQLKAVRKQMKNHKEEMWRAKVEFRRETRNKERAGWWVQGFRDLRLWVIQSALREYEIATNNALPALGLHDWSVRYSISRPKKDGTDRREFHVAIQSPDSADYVPWEAWSGGETQRLSIAGSVGLADLLATRYGMASAIEVWDEPTRHLSPEGIDDLLRFYHDRSRVMKKQIWVVDHHSLDKGDFDGTATVVKDAKGSHIQKDLV